MATLINLYQLSLYLPVATAALGREQWPHWRLSQRLLQLIGLLGLALTLKLARGTARTIDPLRRRPNPAAAALYCWASACSSF